MKREDFVKVAEETLDSQPEEFRICNSRGCGTHCAFQPKSGRTTGTRRCCFSANEDFALLRMTGELTVALRKPGTAMTWTPMPTISRNSSRTWNYEMRFTLARHNANGYRSRWAASA